MHFLRHFCRTVICTKTILLFTTVFRSHPSGVLTLGMGEAETTARREERRYSIFWGTRGRGQGQDKGQELDQDQDHDQSQDQEGSKEICVQLCVKIKFNYLAR